MEIVEKDIFTENQIIDSIEINDPSAEITGYVDQLFGKSVAANGAMVFRVVLNNAQGRRVQLVAWQKNIPILENVAESNIALTVERAFSKSVLKNSKFNNGNVNFELIIGPSTTITVEGRYDAVDNDNCFTQLPVVEFSNILNATGTIKITGYIKNNFAKLISKNMNKGIGSITDGNFKLEVQISNYSQHEFQKGQAVQIIGEVCARYNYSPYFRVADISHITLRNENRASLEFLLNGFRYLS